MNSLLILSQNVEHSNIHSHSQEDSDILQRLTPLMEERLERIEESNFLPAVVLELKPKLPSVIILINI